MNALYSFCLLDLLLELRSASICVRRVVHEVAKEVKPPKAAPPRAARAVMYPASIECFHAKRLPTTLMCFGPLRGQHIVVNCRMFSYHYNIGARQIRQVCITV